MTEPATEQPLVSVVVPTYNESATILDLIGQLSESLPRTVTSEIVVVDDDSPDGTGQAVAGYIERLG
ncbi:MAG TPA: glycosyltransferase, partial [Nitrososphaerales archaeon]|nr:glycosyltransferase [Nitrososphaerales archaeon]